MHKKKSQIMMILNSQSEQIVAWMDPQKNIQWASMRNFLKKEKKARGKASIDIQ